MEEFLAKLVRSLKVQNITSSVHANELQFSPGYKSTKNQDDLLIILVDNN